MSYRELLVYRTDFSDKSNLCQNSLEIDLPTTNHLRQAFPAEWSEIQKARADNIRLNEICTDFESLSLDVERTGKNSSGMSDGLKADCIKIMDALKVEIESWLRLPKKTDSRSNSCPIEQYPTLNRGDQ